MRPPEANVTRPRAIPLGKVEASVGLGSVCSTSDSVPCAQGSHVAVVSLTSSNATRISNLHLSAVFQSYFMSWEKI